MDPCLPGNPSKGDRAEPFRNRALFESVLRGKQDKRLQRRQPQPLAPRLTKAEQREIHAARMVEKARRRAADRRKIARVSQDRADAARDAMAKHKGKR